MGKRRAIIKLLRRFVSQSPPANVEPWIKPNRKLKAAIAKSTRGRLLWTAQAAQRSIREQYMRRLLGQGRQ